jgi:hypothetical protein
MKLLALALLVSISLLPQAHAMNDATYLRKLSFSIRGIPPDLVDYQTLNLVPSAERETFFKTKVGEYLSSKQHRDRMVYRLDELFRLKTPKDSMWQNEIRDRSNYFQNGLKWDSTIDLFGRLATENLSWDSLLTSKSYNLFLYEDDQGLGDFGIFALIERSLLKDGIHGVTVKEHLGQKNPKTKDPEDGSTKPPLVRTFSFPEDDLRVSGVVTSTRFLSRNASTGVNKNRRRAAAIYRTFLCDPMVPAIASGSDRTHEFLDAAFAEKFEVTEEQIKSGVLTKDKHGADAQCLACHYKLDPLGKTFQNIGLVLSEKPVAGALIFKRADNTLVDEPLRGIGDLGKAMVKQPEYAACQVGWFWKEFVGQDVPLSKQKRGELVEKFNSLGRKTNDFIAFLVQSPEFKNPPLKTETVLFSKVEPLLKRCDACHHGDIPTFATLPIGFSGTQEEHEEWIGRMMERTHRPEGSSGKMPKDPKKDWLPEEIALVQKWLEQGAPDDQGKPTTPIPGGVR